MSSTDNYQRETMQIAETIAPWFQKLRASDFLFPYHGMRWHRNSTNLADLASKKLGGCYKGRGQPNGVKVGQYKYQTPAVAL
jgi:hypothetical protein